MTTAKVAKKAATSPRAKPVAQPVQNPERVRRGKGDAKGLIALTVRLSKKDWMALKSVAMEEGETLQTLAMDGFNLLMKSKGKPALES